MQAQAVPGDKQLLLPEPFSFLCSSVHFCAVLLFALHFSAPGKELSTRWENFWHQERL